MARSNKTQPEAKPEATEAPDLFKALLAELEAQGVKPSVKWAPSKSYCSLYVDGQNIGYVFAQTKRGMRVEPAASLADLPKGVKGFKAGTRSARFALVGIIADEASVTDAAAALKAADEKYKAAKAA